MYTRHPRSFARRLTPFLAFILALALALPAAPALAQFSGTLSMPTNLVVAPGQTVVIPVTLTAPENTAYGIDLTITYDSLRMEFVSAGLGSATAGWAYSASGAQAGKVLISMASATALATGGEIALISLKAKAGTTGSVPLTFTRYLVNEQAATIQNGSVRINMPPVATADSYTTNENVTLTVDAPGVLGNDTDPDSDTLTAELGTTVTKGTLTLNANGSFTYVPTPSTNGADSFTYRAADPWGGESADVTVSINVGEVNDPPVANAGGSRTVNEGASITLNGSATDIDNTQAELTFEWDLDNNGSFETAGKTPTFSAAALDGPSTHTVVLKVTDPGGLFDTDSAVITVNNVAPTAVAGGPYTVDEGGSVVLSGSGSSDPAGPSRDPLTYAWNFGFGGSPDATGVGPTFSAVGLTGPAVRTVTLTVNDGDGGTHSANTTVTIRDVVGLDLPELEARWGAQVIVPVTISDLNSTLTNLDFVVTYPTTLLTFNSAAAGALTPGWTVNATPAAGQVHVVMTPVVQAAEVLAPAATTGQIAVLTFTSTNAGSASSTPLTLSAATVNAGSVTDTPTPGSIRLLQRFGLSGSTTYWSAAKAVGNVALALTGTDPLNTTSAASGAWALPQVYEGSHTLTPSKTDQVNGITAYDAALALRHSSGEAPLTGNALTVADVTGEGTVTGLDAAEMLAMSIGEPIDGSFPNTGTIWRFSPATRPYSPLAGSQTGQNFTALLMGDPSGNWDPSGGMQVASPALPDSQALPLIVTVARNSPSTALLTISLVNPPRDTLSLNLTLALSRATQVKRMNAVQPAMVDWAMPNSSTLRVGVAGSNLLQSGAVATLEVALPGGATLNALTTSLMINEHAVLSQMNAIFLPVVGR